MRSTRSLLPWCLLPAACLLTLMACASSHSFSIQFSQVNGLKADAPVIYNDRTIGKVNDVTYTRNADFLVQVELEPDVAHLATRNARFSIVDSPGQAGEKAILVEQPEPGGSPIESGAVVKGYEGKGDTPFEQDMESLATAVENTVAAFIATFQNIQKSEEYQSFKDKLAELETQLKNSSKEMEQTIKKDLLPKLEEKLQDIIKSLEEQGQKDEARELEKEFGKLQDI